MRNEKYFNQVYSPGELDAQLNVPRVGTVMCASVDANPWTRHAWNYNVFRDDIISDRRVDDGESESAEGTGSGAD